MTQTLELLKENLSFSEKCQKVTQKVASVLRTMVKLFLRIHLGYSEECQILINSTTQRPKAFRGTGKKKQSPHASVRLFHLTLVGTKGI